MTRIQQRHSAETPVLPDIVIPPDVVASLAGVAPAPGLPGGVAPGPSPVGLGPRFHASSSPGNCGAVNF